MALSLFYVLGMHSIPPFCRAFRYRATITLREMGTRGVCQELGTEPEKQSCESTPKPLKAALQAGNSSLHSLPSSWATGYPIGLNSAHPADLAAGQEAQHCIPSCELLGPSFHITIYHLSHVRFKNTDPYELSSH